MAFLASDALEGRGTPSQGLEKAADFVADRFRRAGLQPVAGSYFQEARFVEVTPRVRAIEVVLRTAAGELTVGPENVQARARVAVDLRSEPVVILPERLPDGGLEGRVVAGEAGRFPYPESLEELQALHPAAILLFTSRRLERVPRYLEEAGAETAPVFRIFNDAALDAVQDGAAMTATVHVSAPSVRELVLRNVVGLLPGSGDETVLVTAHYDHLGLVAGRLFHGANDNASGVASVIEIAGWLAVLPVRPRRNILFVAFFGEEEDLLGSRYYVRHPLLPLPSTVADINLEQLGRTDDDDGNRNGTFAFTGPSYSSLPGMMAEAAKPEKISVYRKRNGDAYFDRSDNYSFARAGVVAHTLIVAFEFAGYHQTSDDTARIDFGNMAAVDRGIAAGVLAVANAAGRPDWSEAGRQALQLR